jgi:hypothetical protein
VDAAILIAKTSRRPDRANAFLDEGSRRLRPKMHVRG